MSLLKVVLDTNAVLRSEPFPFCRPVNFHYHLYTANEKATPVFDRRIFWDVDMDRLDYDKRATFIIERVFERGEVQDIRNCRRYYGDARIQNVLTGAKWLTLPTVYLGSALFNNNLTDYRCYNIAQSNPEHWLY